MRYQEPIYIQNENAGVRNKDILNVNMSSDIAIFVAPDFIVSGASKIDCGVTTGTTYEISTGTTIPLSFVFTGNTQTFTETSANFKFEVYKFNYYAGAFVTPAVYKSETYDYPSFSGTNTISESISINSLSVDGEYLVKGYFEFNAPTTFLKELGKKVDTLSFKTGKEYGLYNSDLDYYFIAFKSAENPVLLSTGSNTPNANQLLQQVILPEKGITNIVITNVYVGFFVLTLNGLVLAPNLDYTYTGNVVTLNAATVKNDVITVIYTSSGGNNLAGDNINITSPISSGATDQQGTNKAYYNTTTNKFEVYANVIPASKGSIIVMINGVTLANGLDFYQSVSNPKRIILEGDLVVGDMVTLVYFPTTSVVNGLITNNPSVSWRINTAPELVNGTFTLEVSSADTFTTLLSSSSQDYVVGKTSYVDSFTAVGSLGTTLYYRIKNEKNYETLCGDVISTTGYSDSISVVIQTNSINSY